MSDQVLSFGFIAMLAGPVDHEEWSEKLDDVGLNVNYEGTLVFSDAGTKESIYGGMNIIDIAKVQEFVDAVEATGLTIDDTSVRAYCSSWYNGADSYMSDYTTKDFNNAIA